MKILLSTVLCLAASTTLASEAPITGLYVDLHGGYTHANNQHLSATAGVQTESAEAKFDAGYNIGAAVGYEFKAINTRAELEYTHRRNETKSIVLEGFGNVDNGTTANNAYMVNVYYDIPVSFPVIPFVGFGIGDLYEQDFHNNFAYQGILGATYKLNGSNELFTDYKYFASATEKATIDGVQERTRYATNNIEIGYRYKF